MISSIFYIILTIILITSPCILLAIPCLIYPTFRSVQRFVLKKNKDYLKWDLQTILIFFVTIIFAYKNTLTIHHDFTNFDSTGIDILSPEYLNRILFYYPYLLLAYYAILFIFYYINILRLNVSSKKLSFSKILSIDKENVSQKEYIKLSRFILCAIFSFIWWSYIMFLLNSVGMT